MSYVGEGRGKFCGGEVVWCELDTQEMLFYPREKSQQIALSVMNWNPHTIRELERKSIRDFVSLSKNCLTGRVLDFGAGKPGTCRTPQPYRDLVSGEYVAYDVGDTFPVGPFDAILCTQVLQAILHPEALIGVSFRALLKDGGYLVMTGQCNWEEVEDTDLLRFTRSGIRKLLEFCGFEVLFVDNRAEIDLGGAKFSLGWGLVARNI